MILGASRHQTTMLTVIPDLPIHSSVLFAFAAGLFLAALIIRAQRLPERPASPWTAARLMHPTITRLRRLRRPRIPRRGRAERRAPMSENTQRGGASTALAAPETREAPAASAGEPVVEAPAAATREPTASFSVRWGRATVALLGVLALVTSVVTAVVAATGTITFTIPLIALLVFAAAVVGLRAMAVTRRRGERREQLDAALAEAMNPTLSSEEAAAQRRPHVPTTAHTLHAQQAAPFDAMISDARGSGGPRSLQEIDADGLPVDLAETFGDQSELQSTPARAPQAAAQAAPQRAPQRALQATPAEPASQDTAHTVRTAYPAEASGQWRPREVPRPKYLDAEKVTRPLPEPLRPEQPVPSGDVRLNRGDAEPAHTAHATSAAEASQIPAFSTAPHRGSGQQALDLDAVLRRRRA